MKRFEFPHTSTPPDTTPHRGRVIVIDDDPGILDAFSGLLRLEGYACEAFDSAAACLESMQSLQAADTEPVCFLCDVEMPGLSGLQLQQALKQRGDAPLILMSGASGAQEAITGFREGAVDFLLKPIDSDHLLRVLEQALDRSRLQQQNALRRHEMGALLGRLTAREREVVQRVAKGVTNLGISLELGITLRTVKFHRQRALEKLAISGTAELVRLLEEYERLERASNP